MAQEEAAGERVVLPDCCEDYILEYGDFYAAGEEFACPECATGWRRLEGERYGLLGTAVQKTFERRERQGPPGSHATYPYLSSLDGHDPIVDRCCTKLLLRYGPTLRGPHGVLPLRCPICRTEWAPEQASRGGMRVTSFRTARLAEPLAIQRSRTRSFLVPLSAYTLPID